MPSGGIAGVEGKIKTGTPFKMERGRPEGSYPPLPLT